MRNELPANKDQWIPGYWTAGVSVNAIWAILAVFCLGINLAGVAAAKEIKIVAFGTSLTHGYNLPPGTDFCAVLEAKLKARGHDVKIINAGVSGDTSSGGLARLNWGLPSDAEGVMVEFGGNDALRGLSIAETETNLDKILTLLKKRSVSVLFAGMKAPRNLGADYYDAFDAVFPALAKKHGVIFFPFFLDGVAADLKLNQADGIHPNEKGTHVIVRNILPHAEKLIGEIKERRKSAASQ